MVEDGIESQNLQSILEEYCETRSLELRDKLITHYLYLVKYSAGRIGSTLPNHIVIDDLYSSGLLGLIKAVERYDNSKPAKFKTYALLLIRGAIIDELRALDWVPRSVHQKANEIAEAQELLQEKLGREPLDHELASHLGISVEELEKQLVRIRPAIMISLNWLSGKDDDCTIGEKIPDDRAVTSYEALEKQELSDILYKAIAGLPDQERLVMVLYYYEKLMIKEIAKVLGLSESRVSQIHTKALLRLRTRFASLSQLYADIL